MQLFQGKFDALLFLAWYQFVSINDACTRIPTQYGIIMARRSQGFGLFKPMHCFAQKIVRLEPTPRGMLAKLHLRPALEHDSGIICAVVIGFYPGQQFFGLRFANPVPFIEPVGQGEQEHDDGLLVVRINGENVQTNALGFAWFVKQTVAFCFFERSWDGVFMEFF